jgi:hypothetical protein
LSLSSLAQPRGKRERAIQMERVRNDMGSPS